MRKLLAMLCALLAFTLATANSAFASTNLDDAVQLTSALKVTNRISSTQKEVYDVTYSWRDIAKDTCTGAPSGFLEGEGHYSVAQYADSYVSIAWSPPTDVNAKMKFVDRIEPPEHYVTLRDSPSAFYADIVYQNGVGFQCMPFQSGPFTSNDPSGPNGTLPYMAFFTTYPVVYPDGYAGMTIPAAEPKARYVAMGDSFSSGEGNPSYEIGTESGTNECHRSSVAYPRLLQNNSSLDLGAAKFVACSGAMIDNVLNGGSSTGAWGEAAQIDALSEDTEVVTITIGGNDIGFTVFATNCTFASCASNMPAYANIMAEIDNDFQSRLEGLYETILDESGDAKVYVVAYPQLVGDSSNGDCQTFEIVSDLGARAVTSALNGRINDAVNAVKADANNPDYDDRLSYVPANTSNDMSPFDGNFVCSTPPYFNGLDILNQEHSYHPNALGHAAYRTILEALLS